MNPDFSRSLSLLRQERGLSQRQVAKVTAVLERRNRTVIGAVERRGREVWVQPSSDRLPHAVKVVGRTSSIRPGDKIAVSMSSFGSAKLPPMGTLKAAFGRDGTRSASVEAILYQYGIERDFPAPVRAAAELAPSAVEPAARDRHHHRRRFLQGF